MAMPAKDLGNKFVCFKCGTKFYDLKKPEPVCPKCGSDQRESPALKPATETKRSRLQAVSKPLVPEQEEEEAGAADEEEAELESVESDEDMEIPGDED
jgi:uncharacterized protein (TIGR02300 family)